jgi:hypothetical protein
VDESFDLEAPFHLSPPMPRDDLDMAPTLPGTPAPSFGVALDPSVLADPTLVPDSGPPPARIQAGIAPPEAPVLPATPEPPPSPPPAAPAPEAMETTWRAPAPPRESDSGWIRPGGLPAEPPPAPAPPPAVIDTTRVPVVTFPLDPPPPSPPPPPAPPRAPLDVIRLEWTSAPEAPPAAPPVAVPAPDPPAPAPPAPAPPAPAPALLSIPVADVPPPAPTPAAPVPPVIAETPPPPPPAAPAPPEPLASSTLAELYLSQGAADLARSTYEQLVQREPGNERYRARLDEIQRAAPAPRADDERAARRRAIEGQIARLEALLAVVRRA